MIFQGVVSGWLARTYGKRSFQGFYERLHRIALYGLNSGGPAGEVHQSGEVGLLRRLAALWADGPVVAFDVGANHGDYLQALLDAFRGHSHVRIYAFEPAAGPFHALDRVIASAPPGVLVESCQLGLGEKDEMRDLFSTGEKDSSGLSSLYSRRLDQFGIRMPNRETVRLTTLDDFSVKNGISRIQLLKLDVEGHELAVLRGAQQMIEKGAIDYIQFEFGGCNIDSRTYFQDFYYFLNDHFRLYRILRDGLLPLPFYRETDEIFTTTNYLAERRTLPVSLNG